MSRHDHLHDEPIPADIAGVDSALGALAAAERAAAPAGLEARIAAASMPGAGAHAVLASIRPPRLRAAAAGLGLAACAGIAALLALRTPHAGPAHSTGAVTEAALLESAEAAVTVAFADWSNEQTLPSDFAAVGKELDALDTAILTDDSILTEGTN